MTAIVVRIQNTFDLPETYYKLFREDRFVKVVDFVPRVDENVIIGKYCFIVAGVIHDWTKDSAVTVLIDFIEELE